MKKKLHPDLSGVTSMIHLCVVLSAVCFAAVFLTLGILALPALTAAFVIGKDIILRRFDVNDSVHRRFFRLLKENMSMMRYLPLQLIAVVQGVGIIACGRMGMAMFGYCLFALMAFVLTLTVYIITYHVFCKPLPEVPEVLIAMFYKIGSLLAVWALMLIVLVMSDIKLIPIALAVGAIPLILTEAVSFIGVMSFRKASGAITETELNELGEKLAGRL